MATENDSGDAERPFKERVAIGIINLSFLLFVIVIFATGTLTVVGWISWSAFGDWFVGSLAVFGIILFVSELIEA